MICKGCSGTGKIWLPDYECWEECPDCEGSGFEPPEPGVFSETDSTKGGGT